MTNSQPDMRILAIITGEYGQRHVDNIRRHAPDGWEIDVWRAPAFYPPIIDYPEDHLPDALPGEGEGIDLVLAFGEHKGVVELLPEIVRRTGAQAVIAPVDREEWLPRGLARQLRAWLAEVDVTCVTPKPLCSLTETHYNVRQHRTEYDDPLIAEFARHFGRPQFRISADPETRDILEIEVLRDAVCGCARYVAQELVGVPADDAEHLAGLLHHHYPCLASMGIDDDFDDTIMHVSANILKREAKERIEEYRDVRYIRPGNKAP
ncbi:MAG: DUF166 family protein [Chloroflexota bacterium]|nr:DUF166 family protein [Chloroflexota bacterium]